MIWRPLNFLFANSTEEKPAPHIHRVTNGYFVHMAGARYG